MVNRCFGDGVCHIWFYTQRVYTIITTISHCYTKVQRCGMVLPRYFAGLSVAQVGEIIAIVPLVLGPVRITSNKRVLFLYEYRWGLHNVEFYRYLIRAITAKPVLGCFCNNLSTAYGLAKRGDGALATNDGVAKKHPRAAKIDRNIIPYCAIALLLIAEHFTIPAR